MSRAYDSRSVVTGESGVFSGTDVAGVGTLVEMLGGVADQRKPRGVRHRIGAVLAVRVDSPSCGVGDIFLLSNCGREKPTMQQRKSSDRRNRPTTRGYMADRPHSEQRRRRFVWPKNEAGFTSSLISSAV